MKFSSFICSPIDYAFQDFFPFYKEKIVLLKVFLSFIILGFIFRSVIHVYFYMKYEAGIHVNYLFFCNSSWKSYCVLSPKCVPGMNIYCLILMEPWKVVAILPFYRRGKLRNLFELIRLANSRPGIQYWACTASLKHNMDTCSLEMLIAGAQVGLTPNPLPSAEHFKHTL